MSNIQLDIEWTEAASRKIEKLMPRNTKDKDAYLALPPVECLPMEGDVLFLGPDGKQQPFIVAERQYHHDGDADWTIILILDVPQATHERPTASAAQAVSGLAVHSPSFDFRGSTFGDPPAVLPLNAY